MSFLSLCAVRCASRDAGRLVCRPRLPSTPRALSRVIIVPHEPNTKSRQFTQSSPRALVTSRSTARLQVSDVVRMDSGRSIKDASDPVVRTATPAHLAQDFARHQVSKQKQQHSHFHSSANNPLLHFTMVSQTVNKTNLHPSGVQYVLPLVAVLGQLAGSSRQLLIFVSQAEQGTHRDRGGAP